MVGHEVWVLTNLKKLAISDVSRSKCMGKRTTLLPPPLVGL